MDPTDYLPLSHLSFHILLSLVEGPAHGYAMVQQIEERSRGTVSPGTGSFYQSLDKLRGQGLIRPKRMEGVGSGPPRRSYEITADGRAVLRAEAQRLDALLSETRRLGVLAGQDA